MCTRASVLGARFAMFRAPRTQQARAGPWNRANPQELNSRNCRPQEPSAAASICRGHGRCAAATRGSGSQPSSNRPTSPGDGNRRPCERARSSGAAPRSCGRDNRRTFYKPRYSLLFNVSCCGPWTADTPPFTMYEPASLALGGKSAMYIPQYHLDHLHNPTFLYYAHSCSNPQSTYLPPAALGPRTELLVIS